MIAGVTRTLQNNFETTELRDLKLCLGIEISRSADGVFYLTQEGYIDKMMDQFELSGAKNSSIPMDPGYFKRFFIFECSRG